MLKPVNGAWQFHRNVGGYKANGNDSCTEYQPKISSLNIRISYPDNFDQRT